METLRRRRLLLLAPLGIAASGGAGFWALLNRMQAGTYDPSGVPSMLIGRKLPAFALPGGSGPSDSGFSSAEVLAAGRPVLINFFASWCLPCVAEAPVLARLRQGGTAIWGIAYKDQPDATAAFLERNGNPYARLARDAPGRVAIDFGVYGVPETFLVDRLGIVRWRYAGPLGEAVVAQQLDPLLKQYA